MNVTSQVIITFLGVREDLTMDEVDETIAEYLEGWLSWHSTMYVERGW